MLVTLMTTQNGTFSLLLLLLSKVDRTVVIHATTTPNTVLLTELWMTEASFKVVSSFSIAIPSATEIKRPIDSSWMKRRRVLLETENNPLIGGFMVVISNRLPTKRDHCTAWRPVIQLRNDKQRLGVGCARYIVRFFKAPLTLEIVPGALMKLVSNEKRTSLTNNGKTSSSIDDQFRFILTVSTVTFSCYPDDEEWKACPFLPSFCVRRGLFCDGRDNCGLSSDERSHWGISCNNTGTAAETPAPLIITRPCDSIEEYRRKNRQLRLAVMLTGGSLLLTLTVVLILLAIRRIAAYRRSQRWFLHYFDQYYAVRRSRQFSASHHRHGLSSSLGRNSISIGNLIGNVSGFTRKQTHKRRSRRAVRRSYSDSDTAPADEDDNEVLVPWSINIPMSVKRLPPPISPDAEAGNSSSQTGRRSGPRHSIF